MCVRRCGDEAWDRKSVKSARTCAAQPAGGARGREGRRACPDGRDNPNATAGRSHRPAETGGSTFPGLVSGVVRCWQSAQSALWARAQSFPVVASTCEYARALIASRSTRASAMATTVGSRSCSNRVTRDSARVSDEDRRMSGTLCGVAERRHGHARCRVALTLSNAGITQRRSAADVSAFAGRSSPHRRASASRSASVPR